MYSKSIKVSTLPRPKERFVLRSRDRKGETLDRGRQGSFLLLPCLIATRGVTGQSPGGAGGHLLPPRGIEARASSVLGGATLGRGRGRSMAVWRLCILHVLGTVAVLLDRRRGRRELGSSLATGGWRSGVGQRPRCHGVRLATPLSSTSYLGWLPHA
jgi:hypothetical protein